MTAAGHLERVPALPLCMGAVAGVPAALASGWTAVAAAVCSAIGFTILLYIHRRSAWVFLAGAFSSFILALAMRPARLPKTFYDSEGDWTGRVESCRHGERSGKYVVELDSPAAVRCDLLVSSVLPDLRPGDMVRFSGTMERCGKLDGIPGWAHVNSFDMSERISARCVVGEHDIAVVGSAPTWVSRMRNLRYDIADAVYRSDLSPRTARLLVGSWLGGGDVGDDIKDTFRASGLSHLLCVSGFHTAILAAVLSLLLFPIRLCPGGRLIHYTLVAVVIWLYALMSGFQPSVVRASVMISAYLFARISQREVNAFNSLFLAVAVIVFINPYWLFSVGFQLSVSAVAGILLFASKLNPLPHRRNYAYKAAALFCVPLAAMAGTVPVMLYHFHTVPLLSVPVNAVASLLYPVMMIGGAVSVALSYIGLPLGFLATGVDYVADGLTRICDIVTAYGSPRLEIYDFPLSGAMLAILAVAAMALVFHAQDRRIRLFSGCAAAVCLIFVFPSESANATERLLVHGNRSGTDIVAVAGGKGYRWSLSRNGSPITDYSPFYNRHGIAEETAFEGLDGSIEVRGLRIVRAGKGFTECEPCPHILLFDRLYDGDAAATLGSVKPGLVLVSASLKEEKRAEILSACRNRRVAYHDLAQKAFMAGI